MSLEWMRVGISCFQSAANQFAQWATFLIVVSEYGAFMQPSEPGISRLPLVHRLDSDDDQ
jgi:hypothetical protein